MTRPILWRSPSGRWTVNLLTVSSVVRLSIGDLAVYTSGDGAPCEIDADDAPSFLAALDAVSVQPDLAKLNDIAARLDSLRSDPSVTAGTLAVAGIVRDLVEMLKAGLS